MRKVIFLLLSILSLNLSYSQYTMVPDPNFEDFLENNGMGDGVPNNGQVLTANIENVATLNLDSQIGVTDLTGIEDFLALEWFDFSYNLVEQVDLSQNSMLKTLGCTFNPLTTLDLSNNTRLEWISCQGNFLTSLLLSTANLITVECFENQLTSLDVSNAPLLTHLDCNINQIQQLDVSGSPDLEYLIAWANALTEIDVSNNTQLTYLNVGGNDIESIDLSQNSNLISFLAPYNGPLIYLDIRNGNNVNMNGINVTGTDALKCVFVDDASANYLDDWYIDPFTTFVNNEAECDALGTQEFVKTTFKIYPNPANTYLTISSKIEGELSLFSAQGKQVQTGLLNLGLSKVSMEVLSNGMYFLRISTNEGVWVEKIIKK